MTCEIAGSFRRKMPDSGDVDIIMTGEKNNMKDFIKDLSELKEHFASGDIKWMGIAVIDKLPRRVAIHYQTKNVVIIKISRYHHTITADHS